MNYVKFPLQFNMFKSDLTIRGGRRAPQETSTDGAQVVHVEQELIQATLKKKTRVQSRSCLPVCCINRISLMRRPRDSISDAMQSVCPEQVVVGAGA